MAIQHTLFISSTRLKKDTALGGSVDDNLIMPYILLAQDMNILPVLGTDLYEALKTKIQGSSLTGDYKTLMETYIQPALVQFAFAQLAPYLRLRFVNNAVVVMGATEQSSSATYDDIKPLMDTATDAAQFYRQRLIDYLDVVKTPHAGAAEREKLQKDFKVFYSQYDKRRGKDFEKTFPIIGEWYRGI